jgi:hypothetical protein
MGWFTQPDYRLLKKPMPFGGVAFWVRNANRARGDGLVNRMITESVKELPTGFLAVVSSVEAGTAFPTRVYEDLEGGAEVHVYLPASGIDAPRKSTHQNPTSAARAVCELATGVVASLAVKVIDKQFSTVMHHGPMKRVNGPRATMETALERLFQWTAKGVAGAKGVGWDVDTADAKGGASVFTMLKGPDGSDIEVPTLVWRADDGELHCGMNELIVEGILSSVRR